MAANFAKLPELLRRKAFDGVAVCRIVKLNVTMSEPFGENGSNAAVDVAVPDEAGRTEEVETE
jgi:hypothetical protein